MNILMLHDVRPYDENFFSKRYEKHSFLTDTQFINGINTLKDTLLNPSVLLENNIHAISGQILTFDDGLKDHLFVAELLADRKLTAMFFVPFGIINSDRFIDSHLIQFLISSVDNKQLAQKIYDHLVFEGVDVNTIESYKTSRWKNNVWSTEEIFITRCLRESLDALKRHDLLLSLADKHIPYDLTELHDNFYLSTKDIEYMFSLGHHIGSHGYNSIDLRFTNDSVLEQEIKNSYTYLNGYKTDIVSISYANGGYNEKVKNTVAKAGYNFGFGTQHEAINSTHDLLHLPRLDGTKLNIFI